MEETRLLLKASVIEFGETQWDLLPSSCTVCRLVSRTVESAVLPDLRRLRLLLVRRSLRVTCLGTVLSLSN